METLFVYVFLECKQSVSVLREIWSGQVVCVGVAEEPLGGSLRDKQNVSMCFTSVRKCNRLL